MQCACVHTCVRTCVCVYKYLVPRHVLLLEIVLFQTKSLVESRSQLPRLDYSIILSISKIISLLPKFLPFVVLLQHFTYLRQHTAVSSYDVPVRINLVLLYCLLTLQCHGQLRASVVCN